MSDPFVETIDSWTNFFMLTGSVAATLIGLIFVSVSLHIDFIASVRKDSDMNTMARQTFGDFLMILSFAFIFMVPFETPMGVGVPLLILGLMMLARTGKLWLKFARSRSSRGRGLYFQPDARKAPDSQYRLLCNCSLPGNRNSSR